MPGRAVKTPWIVLDTNVVLDWLVFADPPAVAVGHRIEAGQLQWVRTVAMQAELERVLGYPPIVVRCIEAQTVLDIASACAHTLPLPDPLPVSHRLSCTDPDDQGFLDLAMAHQVPWLLSRDKAVLKLARRAKALGVWVMTPHRWCAQQPHSAQA